MAQLKEGSVIKKSTGDEIIATLNDIPGASSIPTKTSELENDSGFVTSSEIPTSLPASGGNADTVGGFTVGVNIPANAKFTDTTYGLANASANGLMSSRDKIKMVNIEVNGIRVYASTETIPTLPIGVVALIYEV